jgi:hypothetical protein
VKNPTASPPLIASLFEDDYLLRELGQVAHVPHVALTELVANAWDAGASKVEITIPKVLGESLVVEDDGIGMSPEQFKHRWMTLRYQRLKHQSRDVEFPIDRRSQKRRAYGKNGIGRHGLLCFADSYEVETWTSQRLSSFTVTTQAGESPFVITREVIGVSQGNGTRLNVRVVRHLPSVEEILTTVSARFSHDPTFKIFVNGQQRPFESLGGRVSEERLEIAPERYATVTIIDSTQLNATSLHQGIAFWSQKRLIGTPTWAVGSEYVFDGRTRFARRYKVIVDTEGYEDCVNSDWTAFNPSDEVSNLFKIIANHIRTVAVTLASEVAEDASEDALVQNRSEFESLGRGAQTGVVDFTRALACAHPTATPDFLATAVKAVINMQQSGSGAELLRKLSTLAMDDLVGLDKLLGDWTVTDALRVLDEIDSRIKVIEAIERLANNPETDELHTLHPLILRSRWIFGPEFESEEYCSNNSLRTLARDLFKNSTAVFSNERNRPDIVVLGDRGTCEITGIEDYDSSEPNFLIIKNILLIELKRGGSEITRAEVNQADGYIQDITLSGAISGQPYINGWVVGHKVGPGVAKEKTIGEIPARGRLRVTTFNILVSSANRRLFKLRDALKDRYTEISDDELISRVLNSPLQGGVL